MLRGSSMHHRDSERAPASSPETDLDTRRGLELAHVVDRAREQVEIDRAVDPGNAAAVGVLPVRPAGPRGGDRRAFARVMREPQRLADVGAADAIAPELRP